jgi:16S rRNA (adenine1518-N6/adenine1519-N6)-dimethyltransferase
MGSRPNVELVLGDILKLSPKELLGGRSGELCLPYKVVANLPYYITSPVLRHFLWSARKPSLMVVMVQKEVGEAIAATEGKQSLLALMVHLFSRPTIVRRVPARSFRPPPRVNSVVLRLDVCQEPAVSVPDIEGLFQVIRAGFSSPRKQLRNSLAVGLGLPTNDTVTLLSRAGIVQTRRAETLSLDEWKRLWEVWSSLGEVYLASGEGPGQDQPGA